MNLAARVVKVLTLLAAAALALSASAGAEKPPLRWAADAEGGAPYIFKDPKNPAEHLGFEVELARALGAAMGRQIVFQQYDYKSLFKGLLRGDFDLAMNGLEVTADRLKQVSFTRPYYVYTLQLVARRGETRFTDLAGVKAVGGTVGTLEETAAERLLASLGINKRVYEGQVEPYNELANERIDAVLLDLPIAQYYGRPNHKLRYVGAPSSPGHYAIALKPGNAALAAELDAGLAKLIASGALETIYRKWGIWNDAQHALPRLTADAARASPAGLAALETEWTLRRYLPMLLEGAWTTVRISFLAMMLAVALGLCIAVVRLYAPRWISWTAVVYIEFFRGIPVLLLLFFLYYGLPEIAALYELPFSLKLSPLEAAVLGFGLNYAAYEAEIYRAGILSVPHGQWEAAAALGLRRRTTFRRIILPQAVRFILPPMTSDFVALFKDTSVVSIIAVVELSKQYQILAKSSGMYLEIALATAALYLIMSVPLGYLSRRLEARWTKPA